MKYLPVHVYLSTRHWLCFQITVNISSAGHFWSSRNVEQFNLHVQPPLVSNHQSKTPKFSRSMLNSWNLL